MAVFVFFIVAVVLIFVVSVVIFLVTGTVQERHVVRQLADRNGGYSRRFQNAQTAFFHRNGVDFRAAVIKRKGRRFLRVIAKLPSENFRLKIFEDELEPKLKKFLGMQDLKIGDPEFDEAFVIQSNSIPELLRVLDAPTRQALLKLGSKSDVNILRGLFTCHVPCWNQHAYQAKLENVLDAFFMLVEKFRFPDDPIDLAMELTESEEVVCLVCGELIHEQRVDCVRCKTPHHHDCWEYLGMCSTYACGSTRSRASASRGKDVFKIS